MSKDSLKGGLDYITGRVDSSGEVYIIDVGRDRIHDEPLIIATWEEETHREDRSFANTVFSERYLAHDFTPEENTRIAYDHDIRIEAGERLGAYSSVEFFDIESDLRVEVRKTNSETYEPDEEALKTVYSLLSG